jgi:signal transduction histidine kinase
MRFWVGIFYSYWLTPCRFIFLIRYLKTRSRLFCTEVFLAAMFFLGLLVDWILLGVMTLWCMASAFAVYSIITPKPEIPQHFVALIAVSILFIMYCAVFKEKNEVMQQEKILTMKLLSGSIAHELRTPLASVTSIARGVKKFLPHLLEAYRLAQEANLPVKTINSVYLDGLGRSMDNLEHASRQGLVVIDMLLTKIKHSGLEEKSICSILECVEQALEDYPLSESEHEHIHCNKERAFMFDGNKVLIIHVIFNLMKNALYSIKDANKGDIWIWFESDEHENRMHFKDTGKGIDREEMDNVFLLFYSKTRTGTGLGLSFCKMVMKEIGGDIVCKSEKKQYTEFTLKFPIIAQKKESV